MPSRFRALQQSQEQTQQPSSNNQGAGSVGNAESSSSSSCDCSAIEQPCQLPQQQSPNEESLTILYQGDGFRNYLEYHAINYQVQQNPKIDIELVELPSTIVTRAATTTTTYTSEISETQKGQEDNDVAVMEQMHSVHWDGSIFPSYLTGAMVESNQLWDLTNYVKSTSQASDGRSSVDWTDVMPFVRYTQSAFGNKVLTIPFDTDILTLYYRKDLFEKYNVPVPRTWEEYHTVASFFHGKSISGEGMGNIGGGRPGSDEQATAAPTTTVDEDDVLYGSCVSFTNDCVNAYWASLVLSTMTQAKGTSSGYLVDPDSTEPLLGEAMEETLRILANQTSVGPTGMTESHQNCLAVNFEYMNRGKCAMTYNWGDQLLVNNDGGYEIGVAPTPGSTKVLNRSTGRLDACTPESCPHGTYYDDIGIVNRPAYSAFGGWVGGVSNAATSSKQRAVADFFSYLSNQGQSLPDVLPNPVSTFADPYRYSHVDASHWAAENGFDNVAAVQYTDSIHGINSDNTVMEFRVPPGMELRKILDEEVSEYLKAFNSNASDDPRVRQDATSRMNSRMKQSISDANSRMNVTHMYQTSLEYSTSSETQVMSTSMNYIDSDFRAAGWGLAGLICFTSLVLIVWTIWFRRNRVMRAFQPYLLIQSAVGLFFLGGSIVPLGFDDSLFSDDILDVTCMVTPWIYIFGFSLFFSSVYSKIHMCDKIFKDPDRFDILLVTPFDSFKVFFHVFLLNGVILSLWTALDPLKWVREEMSYSRTITGDGIQTYGACRGEGYEALGYAATLFFLNLILCFVGAFQAFKCRFLVLEYNEIQWLPLALFPFFESWIIGGPLLMFTVEDPTNTFVILTIIISASSITAALAVFAPKDWYIRKNSENMQNKRSVDAPARTATGGILVLNHPTVESRKQVSRLKYQLEQVTAYNTELVTDIRTMKEKFRQMTEREKAFVAERVMAAGESNTLGSSEHRVRGIEDASENTPGGHEDGLAAMEHFASVWSTHDDDILDDDDVTEPEESEVAVTGVPASRSSRSNSLGTDSREEVARDSQSGGLIERGANLLGGVIFARNRRSIAEEENNFNKQSPVAPNEGRTFEDDYEEVPISGSYVSVFEDDDSKEYHVALAASPPSKPYSPYIEQTGHSSEGDRSLAEVDDQPATEHVEHDSSASFAEDTDHSGDDLQTLTKKIEIDDLRALEAEASILAEQFKMNSTFLESISDLQGSTDENERNKSGLHNLDISKITVGTGTTDDEDRNLGIPDSMFGSPYRSVNKSTDLTQDMYESSSFNGVPVTASAGESSGAAVGSAWRMLETIDGKSMQNAGEPSGAGPPSSESFEGYFYDEDDDDYNVKHPIPVQYQSPRRQDAVPRSPAAVKPPLPTNSYTTESPTSRSSQKNVSYSIADWSAVGMTGGLLADLSDSQSNSSYAESYSDSVSTMDASGRPSGDLDIPPLDREIDDLVAHSDFDAVKVAAETYGISTPKTNDETAGDDEGKDRLAKIAQRKQKKRDLEAWRISLSRSFEKSQAN